MTEACVARRVEINGIVQGVGLGRLFDGIAAIAGIRSKIAFEGQAAMELEMLADNKKTDVYDYEWMTADRHTILPRPIIKGVVTDMLRGVHPAVISGKFHRPKRSDRLSAL